MNLKLNNKYLIRIAAYSYSLYLLHGFGTSGGRIILKYCGIHNEIIVFFVALLFAIIIPIFVDKILKHFPLFNTLFLGKKLISSKNILWTSKVNS